VGLGQPLVSGTALLAVPVVGLASGALSLGEPVSALDLARFALTLAGVALLAGRIGRGDRGDRDRRVAAIARGQLLS
jgi:drug/metabolite transporter (DMT)-like permease